MKACPGVGEGTKMLRWEKIYTREVSSLNRAGRGCLRWMEEELEGERGQVSRLEAQSIGFLRHHYLSVASSSLLIQIFVP